MIEELRIRSLGVIDEAIIPFVPGLTVLTGETGAGKTMVLSGLALIRGEKADASAVRAGAERADVDGRWRLSREGTQALFGQLDEAGVEVESEGDVVEVLLARSVNSAGRSRAFAGGRSVPASLLAEITDHLVAVHGQSDQLLLRDPGHQRELLDLFGGPQVRQARGAYAQAFGEWRAAARELEDVRTHRAERDREAALLRLGIEEIDAVRPEPGEDEALKAQAAVLAHASDLLGDVGAAHDVLAGDGESGRESVMDLLGRARRSLERACSLDPTLVPSLEQLTAVADEVAQASTDLAGYATTLDADPARQEHVEGRRHDITELKRKYGPELDDVLAWWEQARTAVAAADGVEDRLVELESSIEALRTAALDAAQALSDARRGAASEFARAVSNELHDLAMPDATVIVGIDTETDPERFGADGADTITMMLAPHEGAEPRPLGRGASGGELSRLMLAIEVVLAGARPVPTFVFDEVDAGIGGKVAVEVGRRLARLARTAQVVVVTHLPQVAAFADRHVVVTKDRAGQVTQSSVAVVEGPERVRELVRMLSGLEDSASGAEHAAELLALAEADRGRRA